MMMMTVVVVVVVVVVGDDDCGGGGGSGGSYTPMVCFRSPPKQRREYHLRQDRCQVYRDLQLDGG